MSEDGFKWRYVALGFAYLIADSIGEAVSKARSESEWRGYMRRVHGTSRGWLAKRWWQVWR